MASTAIMDERSGLKHFERDNPMAHSKPTFVLVHGGWQGPSLWTYVIPLLERAGYATYPVTLVSPDSDPPVEDFTADVEVVRRAVDTLLECGKDVILVLFSYAGYVGCEALKSFHDEQSTPLQNAAQNTGPDGGVDKSSAKKTDLPSWFARPRRGKILHIAFIASYIVAPGMTLWSPRKGDCLPGMENKDGVVRVLDGPERFFSDLPRPIAEFWATKLRSQPIKSFYSRFTYPAYLYYPTSYLACIDDKALAYKIQDRMAKLAKIDPDRVVRVRSGHMVMVSQPMAVAKFLRQAAGETFSVL
ncbi:hypothetical protein DTO027B5_7079 [Paecilomyces variotii]|nr:hypothetical protein DTO169C6_5896 [Paecilomyces variotii]KAJ9285269.1 hypothetical protein DTO021C3_7187 [Paecilomyces variotii]KAJ9321496.1 hypothetical protein DTO027B3_7529 [Paecilomyces variotii]KAJ9331116.1 hypothetical protein DTO027B5_7079 [Paecilomyces variotii]